MCLERNKIEGQEIKEPVDRKVFVYRVLTGRVSFRDVEPKISFQGA